MFKWVMRILLLAALALPAAGMLGGCVSVGDNGDPLVDVDVDT